MSWEVRVGDCLEVLATLEPCSVDAVATDPPYNLSFMAKPWDSHAGREDAGFAYWLAGMIDGEGCFTIKAHTRGTHAPCFTLKMRADERATLELCKRTLGIGTITEEKREPNPMVKWSVQDKAGCQRLVDLLDKYPLRAKKRIDYMTWREAVCEWTRRPRGNRWHGAVSDERMAALRSRIMSDRAYTDVPWSGHNFQDWCRLWAQECLRILKPGGHVVAFGGSRTWHRLACAIEDAGFEIRDTITWHMGSGFPKSLNVSAALREVNPGREVPDGLGTALKPATEFIVLARKPLSGTVAATVQEYGTGALNISACRVGGQRLQSEPWEREPSLCDSCAAAVASATKPATPGTKESTATSDAEQTTNAGANPGHSATSKAVIGCSNGLFREAHDADRSDGTASSIGRSGKSTGARSRSDSSSTTRTATSSTTGCETCASCGAEITPDFISQESSEGRWPPNLILTHSAECGDACAEGCPVAELDRQSGESVSRIGKPRKSATPGSGWGMTATGAEFDDSGGASRYFPRFRYTPKAAPSERNAGLDGMPEEVILIGAERHKLNPMTGRPVVDIPRSNHHPTVKPIDLMRWLCRLITPPGGLILDPFAGSGTTGIAALREGFRFLGIERDPDYAAIARRRIEEDAPLFQRHPEAP